MYLTSEANETTLREIARFAPGTTFATTFLLALPLIDPDERSQHEMVYQRAREAGTPFISFYSPNEILQLAQNCGFKNAQHISRNDIIARYFQNHTDGLKPSSGEEFLIAQT